MCVLMFVVQVPVEKANAKRSGRTTRAAIPTKKRTNINTKKLFRHDRQVDTRNPILLEISVQTTLVTFVSCLQAVSNCWMWDSYSVIFFWTLPAS